ncbi:hypothetical protein DM02DRAFT_614724 [Periconia macrospinosa]|uniref:Glycine zipper 2TM domain-containing protein n=1 Tax=Periconia macrospinosa TaxID=97972 RepID=A0A2V1DPK0_9PLEO|nr:hypothetical protein DM02DRAFT_614724 [Periconia macrospinosa]
MSVLALKALSVGADRIPDKFFEKVPGGYFKPPEKKSGKKSSRRQSEQPSRQRRRSPRDRDRSPQSDYYSGYSDYDTDYEQGRRRSDRRRRAKSVGRSPSPTNTRSMSRGRDRERDAAIEEERIAMDGRDRGQQFPPPPVSEYRPYDPRDYAPPTAAAANTANAHQDPYARQSSATRPDYGYPPQPSSATAARYTPANGYSPSPAPGSSPIPPPNPAYAAYVPADYAASPVQRPANNAYPSPPPFYRQESRSQPSVAQSPYPNSQNQLTAYDPPPRQSSVSSSHHHRRGEKKHHRTRSADQHRRSHSRVTDKVRDRLENLDLQDRNLAASVGGALAGGLMGRQLGHGTLSTLIGAGIGAIGGREIEKRHEIDKAERRSRSRHSGRRRDYSPSRDRLSDDSFSDSDTTSSRRKRGSSRHRYNY